MGFFADHKLKIKQVKKKKVTQVKGKAKKLCELAISRPKPTPKHKPILKKLTPTLKKKILSFEDAPPDNFKLVLATTTIKGFKICAPANILRQHMQYDKLNNIARITNWKYVKADPKMGTT